MKITSKGQVTIPQAIREQAGLLPHTEVEFVLEGNAVRIVRSNNVETGRGQKIVDHLRGRATLEMTTDELMALLRGED